MPADPVDALVTDVAGADLDGRTPRRCLVLDDRSGALTAWCLQSGAAEVRLACDSLLDERAALAALSPTERERVLVGSVADPAVVAEVDLVLWRLPQAVDAVRTVAERVAAGAAPDVLLVGGARVRHLVRAMNPALERGFTRVHASLGRQKSRALVGQAPRPGVVASTAGVTDRSELGFAVHAEAGVFAGTRVDAGTRLLLRTAERWPGARVVVDLGCGSGILATVAARRLAPQHVLAVDVSAAACRSAAATAAAAGVGALVQTVRTAGLEDDDVAPGTVELVLCNPPFHRGAAKDSGLAVDLIGAAGRALAPGGELWAVWNSHLPYRGVLRSAVGPTEVVVQDRAYTVTRSVRRSARTA